MMLSVRSSLRLAVVASALAGLAATPSHSVGAGSVTTIERPGFSVTYDGVSDEAAAIVADRVGVAIQLVAGFLGQSKAYRRPEEASFIEVVIDPERGPYQSGNRIHVPLDRVLNLHGEVSGERTDLNLVHEVTHVLAESFGRKDHDRFYDDGLAVYLQHRFGQESSYPNFGQDLYIAYGRAAAAHGESIPLALSETVRNEKKSGTGRKLAYLQEGAFTQYLIDRFGLDAYLRVFDGDDFAEVTGMQRADAERDWRALMSSFESIVSRATDRSQPAR